MENDNVTPEYIQQILDENGQMIKVITKCQSEGRMMDCMLYQTRLQLNLVHLASLADNRPHPSIGIQSNKGLFERKDAAKLNKCLPVFIQAVKENGMTDLNLISNLTKIHIEEVIQLSSAFIDFLKRQCRTAEANKLEGELMIYTSNQRDNTENGLPNFSEINLLDTTDKPLE